MTVVYYYIAIILFFEIQIHLDITKINKNIASYVAGTYTIVNYMNFSGI